MTDTTLTSSQPTAPLTEDGVATPRGVAAFLGTVVAVLAGLAYAVLSFGPWVLGITALATVPVIFLALILLTRGK